MKENINYRKSLKVFMSFALAIACCFAWLMPQALTEYTMLLQITLTILVLALNYAISSTTKQLSSMHCFIFLTSFFIPFIISFLGHQPFSVLQLYGEFLIPLELLAFVESLYTLLLMEKKNNFCFALLGTISLGVCTTFNVLFTIYYTFTKAIFDDFAILSIYQTNWQEALEYVNTFISYPLFVIGLLLLFCQLFFLYHNFRKLSVKYPPCKKHNITLILALLLLTELALFFIHTPDNFMLRTLKQTNSTIQIYKEYYKKYKNSRNNILQSNIDATKENPTPGTYILIIGESETRNHMGAYGYQRNTTPWLTQEVQKNPYFILFSHSYSCDSGTVSVLSKALTETNNYNNIPLQEAVSIIDVAKRAGFETIWVSNQMRYGPHDSPTTVMVENTDKQIWLNHDTGGVLTRSDHYDEDLLPKLRQLDPAPEAGRLVIVHLMGCHAAYKDRYPYQFNKFTDSTGIKALSGIKDLQLYNEYDNAVLHNDYILQELFALGQKELNATAIIYMSDHGEELRIGYGHNHQLEIFDYCVLRIPFFIAYNPHMLQNTDLAGNLRRHATLPFTNDLLYDTLIGLMRIKTSHYNSKYDLSSPAFSIQREELKATKKQRKISDDPYEKYLK